MASLTGDVWQNRNRSSFKLVWNAYLADMMEDFVAIDPAASEGRTRTTERVVQLMNITADLARIFR